MKKFQGVVTKVVFFLKNSRYRYPEVEKSPGYDTWKFSTLWYHYSYLMVAIPIFLNYRIVLPGNCYEKNKLSWIAPLHPILKKFWRVNLGPRYYWFMKKTELKNLMLRDYNVRFSNSGFFMNWQPQDLVLPHEIF